MNSLKLEVTPSRPSSPSRGAPCRTRRGRSCATRSRSTALPRAFFIHVSRAFSSGSPNPCTAKSTIVVVPPNAAAVVPVSKSSEAIVPPKGSSMCVWTSMPPGMTYLRLASIRFAPAALRPVADRGDLLAVDQHVGLVRVGGGNDRAAGDERLRHRSPPNSRGCYALKLGAITDTASRTRRMTADDIRSRGESRLADTKERLANLESAPPQGRDALLRAVDDLQLALANIASDISVLVNVHPDLDAREACEAIQQQSTELGVRVLQSRPIYDALMTVSTTDSIRTHVAREG